MNNYIIFESEQFDKKLYGHVMMLNYRMSNMCIKADPVSLLPVTIFLAGSAFNFEDVAEVSKPDEFTFDVVPKNQNNLQNIIAGIFDMHPEFKMELKEEYDLVTDKDVTHIIYTMPEVNKDRRKLMTDAVKLFHTECKASIDLEYTQLQARLVEPYLSMKPGEVDEANNKFNETKEKYLKMAQEILDTKLAEIEEGYQRYLQKCDEEEKASKTIDFTKGFKMHED